ncbi:MAG: glutamate ABC transporter substrate-binding protein, partial [Ilumatobacteraceae bacterium]
MTAVAVLVAAGCGAPQLADPPEITLPPTTAPQQELFPECDEAEQAEEATRSYAPDGATDGPSIEEIRANDRLVVGVSADTLQFGARNPLTGAIEGFDVAILQEIAGAIFGEGGESKIEYRVMTYAERLPALENGDVDLVAHTMTINCDRWKRIAFSSTYYDAGQKVLVPIGSEFGSIDDLVAVGGRVCVPGGSTNLEEISREEYTAPEDGGTGIEVVERPDITDCLVAMQQGDADAATGDDTVLVGLAAQDPNLIVVGEPLTREPYGVGVRGDRVDLVRFVNGVLEDVRA